jgi:O-acetyl-ADP-ribose deacetylase (regulator of RNase III)
MAPVIREVPLPSARTLKLVRGDLTEEAVDAIVNAANAHLQHGGGVAGAIVRRGGRSIQEESDRWVRVHGAAGPGHPALTGAGSLPCRAVIHTVGPVWGEGDEDRKLAAAVMGALALATAEGFRSLSLPAISTGIFGFPKGRGAQIIVRAVLDFFAAEPASSLAEVRITVVDAPTLKVFRAEFERRWPPGETT